MNRRPYDEAELMQAMVGLDELVPETVGPARRAALRHARSVNGQWR